MSQTIQETVVQAASLTNLCQMMGISRTCYYRGLSAPEPAPRDTALREQIQQVALERSCFGMVLLWLPPHYERAAPARRQGKPQVRFAPHARGQLAVFAKETVRGNHKQRPRPSCVPKPCRRNGHHRARPALGLGSDLYPSGPRVHLPGCCARCVSAPLPGLVPGPPPRCSPGNDSLENGTHRKETSRSPFRPRRSICVGRIYGSAQRKRYPD